MSKGLRKSKKALTKPAATLPPRRLRVMVSSSVYHQRTEVHQLCGLLSSYGYDVLNSEIGTIYPPLGSKDITLDACLQAVRESDIFLGIITPFYGTSGYTHQEFKQALSLNKPRRFICHANVTFARKLLEPLRYDKAKNGKKRKTKFVLPKSSVLDDMRVIDMYEEVVQTGIPKDQWGYRWVQEYYHFHEALRHIQVLFEDKSKVEAELANFNRI